MGKTKLESVDVERLRTADAELSEVLTDLDKLEQCGVDCQHYKANVSEAKRRIQMVTHHFGPDAV